MAFDAVGEPFVSELKHRGLPSDAAGGLDF